MYENVNIDSLFTLSNCFYSSFIFLAFLVCIARLLTSFHELEHGSKIILVFTIVFIYLQMDFVIYLNHLIHELKQQISYDERHTVRIVRDNKELLFDLTDPKLELIICRRKKTYYRGKFLDQNYGKYILKNENGICEFSELLIKGNRPFELFLRQKPTQNLIRKQFIFFWK